MTVRNATTILRVQTAGSEKIPYGRIELVKGILPDGSVSYALFTAPYLDPKDDPAKGPYEYLGSLTEDDSENDTSAILGALTKIRLLLEELSKKE